MTHTQAAASGQEEDMAKITEIASKWIGRQVRGSGETLDHEPSRTVARVYLSESSTDGTRYVAWTGEHVTAPTLEALERRLAALAQPVQRHGRLSHGRYEVR